MGSVVPRQLAGRDVTRGGKAENSPPAENVAPDPLTGLLHLESRNPSGKLDDWYSHSSRRPQPLPVLHHHGDRPTHIRLRNRTWLSLRDGLSRSPWLEQATIPGLLEVMIGGEGLPDSFVVHEGEADAVRESPLLVGSSLIELPSPLEPVPVNGNNGDPLGGKDCIEESDDAMSIRWSGEAVGDFCQDVVGSDVLGPAGQKVLMQIGGFTVQGIALIGQGEPGRRIDEDFRGLAGPRGHLSGTP